MPKRILLIDDTPEIAELLTFALRDRGYQVLAVGYDTGVEALLGETPPDAIVLDCSAFEMSLTLFDAIRAMPEHETLPLVIVTDTPEKAVASLRRREAAHVLLVMKPFTGSQVAVALDQLLQVQT